MPWAMPKTAHDTHEDVRAVAQHLRSDDWQLHLLTN